MEINPLLEKSRNNRFLDFVYMKIKLLAHQGNSCWRGRIARLFRNIRINNKRCSAARRVRSNRTLVVSFFAIQTTNMYVSNPCFVIQFFILCHPIKEHEQHFANATTQWTSSQQFKIGGRITVLDFCTRPAADELGHDNCC